MELDAFFFLISVPAVVFSGMSKGGLGSAVSFAATPFLALILTPGQAIGLMLPLLIVMDVTALRAYWGKWDLRVAVQMICGAVPGIIIASLVYTVADPDVFRLLIGIIAVGFVFYQLLKGKGFLKNADASKRPSRGLFWGVVAGFTSFISHAGGPPATIHLLTQKLDKTTFQATSVLFFFTVNLIKVVPYVALGIFSKETLKADLILFPAGVLGVLLGVYLHKRISSSLFFAMSYVFLAIVGVKLIFDALT